MRHAFTVMELMLVLAVLGVVAGMSLAVGPMILAGSKVRSTQATIHALATAMETAGPPCRGVEIPGLGVAREVVAWDVNGDGWIDGDPERDAPHPDPLRSAEREWSDADRAGILAHLPGYRGAVHGLTTLSLPDERIDAGRRPVDAWRRPLRVAVRRDPAGRRSLGVYSLGPDGVDQNGAGDDLHSW